VAFFISAPNTPARETAAGFFMQTRNYAAQMLLVGFCKHWKMATVYGAIGSSTDEVAEVNALAEFMPMHAWQLNTPVRAYIAAQWPKLSEWLLANDGNPKKLLTVIPQIERLKSKAVHASKLNADDVKEAAKDRAAARNIHASNRLARSQQLSTQRGAWNVCKA
jgi:hypothetical protein